jgi:hypothetical protein
MRWPCSHRTSPVDAFQQHRQLRARQCHRAAARLWPHEARSFQALGKQTHPVPVMPQHFQQITASSAKEEHLPVEGILEQLVLHQRSQTIKAASKIGHARRQPNTRTGWNSDHWADKISSTFMSAARSTPPWTRTRYGRVHSISIQLASDAGAARLAAGLS